MSLKILGTGRCIPKRMVPNSELATFLDTNDEWIVTRTGIKTRFVCTDESLTDLCTEAALIAVKKSGISISEIDLIICSTMSGDYTTPSLACAVAERLKTDCPAFDINAACSGFIYSLEVASMYLKADKEKNILIISAEMMSKHVDWNDRGNCILFGDGAGACIVTGGNALQYINLTANGDTIMLKTVSGTGNSPFIKDKKENGFLQMDGQEVFKFAVGMIEKECAGALAKLNLTPGDIDFFVLHQANKRIIETARTRMKQPEEKFPYNIDKYGNMSSASIVVLLDEMLEENRIKKGDKLLLCAFGAGMTTGTCVINWE